MSEHVQWKLQIGFHWDGMGFTGFMFSVSFPLDKFLQCWHEALKALLMLHRKQSDLLGELLGVS